jgi:hypothetical protein
LTVADIERLAALIAATTRNDPEWSDAYHFRGSDAAAEVLAARLAAAGVTLAPVDSGARQRLLDVIHGMDPQGIPPGGIEPLVDAAIRAGVTVAPQSLDVERVAAFLHDQYGCRVTCRGGRLADDRHPSHNEAYRDQAERLVAAAGVTVAAQPAPDALPIANPSLMGDIQRGAYEVIDKGGSNIEVRFAQPAPDALRVAAQAVVDVLERDNGTALEFREAVAALRAAIEKET